MSVNLFEPYRIGNLELQNRFMRSATWDGSADTSGAVTDASVALYRELAKGGIGLIVTGFTFVSLPGKAVFGQYGVYDDKMIPGLQWLVNVVHDGGSKIALQVHHAGISARYTDDAQAVSPVAYIKRVHHEMTEDEIEALINDFVAAAIRAREAGFDAVQLHGAHGYLMSQFLSPVLNRRVDQWGSTLANRARFHLEVIRRTRKAVGSDYPLLIKFGIRDESERGLTLGEGIEVGRLMEQAGIDGIEVSAGVGSLETSIPVAQKGDPEIALFRDRAASLKKSVHVPVAVVCGIRSLSMAEDIINSGDADMISMCRPFIREPGLIKRWLQRGTPSTCISCHGCHGEIMAARGLRCVPSVAITGGISVG